MMLRMQSRKIYYVIPQLFIEYESGLRTYINFGEKPWIVEAEGTTYHLPQYGFLAYMPGQILKCMSVFSKTDKRTDRVYSDKLYYFKSDGEIVDETLGGSGSYLLKKKLLNGKSFLWM